MKTALIQKTAFLLLASLLSVSCKKETNLLGNKEGISHAWKLHQQGNDLNNNGVFDAGEKNLVQDSARVTYQFKNDGNGYRVGFNNIFVDTFTWRLINGESVIHMAINSKGFINNLYFHYEYGPKTLILRDTTVTPAYFRYFERVD